MTEEERFEQELTSALRAAPVPAGFADRVLARAQATPDTVTPWPRHADRAEPRQSAARQTQPPRSVAIRLALAACLLLTLCLGGAAERRHRQAVEANRQFALAMEITNQTLGQAAVAAREQLGRVSLSLPTR